MGSLWKVFFKDYTKSSTRFYQRLSYKHSKMKIAYCCKCVYRMDFCKIKMFPEMYVYFVKDIETGFRIHLDMFVAKKNDIVISCCDYCLHKILIKTCVTPKYPDDDVCIAFCKCYVNT